MDTSEKKQTILIVEDDPSLLSALRDKLAREGFTILEAKNGEEGLAIALREHPHLVLLDIVMPKMSGMVMLHQMREDSWGKSVHVIMLTNLSDTEDIARAMEDEAFEYFVKTDVKIEDIIVKIKEKLKR